MKYYVRAICFLFIALGAALWRGPELLIKAVEWSATSKDIAALKALAGNKAQEWVGGALAFVIRWKESFEANIAAREEVQPARESLPSFLKASEPKLSVRELFEPPRKLPSETLAVSAEAQPARKAPEFQRPPKAPTVTFEVKPQTDIKQPMAAAFQSEAEGSQTSVRRQLPSAGSNAIFPSPEFGPYSYKAFMLQSIKGPRIIIDGDSNARTSIDSALFERAVGLPVINIADIWGFSFEMKLARLLKYAKKGDTVIMSLTYDQFAFEPKFPSYIFSGENVKFLFDYYNMADTALQTTIRRKYPVQYALERGQTIADQTYERQAELEKQSYQTRFNKGDRGENTFYKLNEEERALYQERLPQKIDQRKRAKFRVSYTFANRLELVKTLQKKGVSFYFAWPANADDIRLFDGSQPFAEEERAIRDVLDQHGIPILGRAADSYFGFDAYIDNSFHVFAPYKRIRSQRLLEAYLAAKGSA